jgi:periplasmic copper chaperone A
MSLSRTSARLGGVLTVAGLAVLITAGPASAHVTANVTTAVQGHYAKITFKVPNEDPTAGTVKVQVTLPVAYPISGGSTKPVPGWKAQIEKVTLDQPVKENKIDVTKAVKTITWTADPGTRISQGEFQEFDVSVGPLPDDTDELIMPAVQTYDSGKVVNWTDQPPAAGQKEPEHPAPSIKLQTKPNDPGTTDMGGHDAGAAGTTPAAAGASDTDNTARWLGGAGLVVGALGLGFGVGAVLRSRRPATSGAEESKAEGSKSE